MTDRRYINQEVVDISELYTSKRGKQFINERFSSFCRCFKCHSLLIKEYQFADKSSINHFVIREGNTLKAICSKCIEAMLTNNEHMLTREGCGRKFHNLYTHHWYDPKDYSKIFFKEICQFCNTKLTPSNLWIPYFKKHHKHFPFDHILPNWELQKLYLSNYKEYRKQREVEYSFPLPYPPTTVR